MKTRLVREWFITLSMIGLYETSSNTILTCKMVEDNPIDGSCYSRFDYGAIPKDEDYILR